MVKIGGPEAKTKYAGDCGGVDPKNRSDRRGLESALDLEH